MVVLQTIFWILFVIIFYTYFGYGLLLWLYMKLRGHKRPAKMKPVPGTSLPKATIIIAAYNEEDFIREKIINTLNLEYPPGRSQIIIVTDGSTDETASIVSEAAKLSSIIHLHKTERTGKGAAINRAVEYAHDAEILVFSDANSLLNTQAIAAMANYYGDASVGGVAGEKKVIAGVEESLHGKGEGLYWEYESSLKKIDSDFYTVVGAAGELFSIRKSLFERIPEDMILDDFIISMGVCRKGHVVKYEPAAYAIETPSITIAEEQKRKVRISAGSFQAMSYFIELFNFWRFGKLSFQFISRRVLRWAICPFALPLLLLVNILIVWNANMNRDFYFWFGIAQSLFYLAAFAGWLFSKISTKRLNLFFAPFYFVFMHAAVWSGLLRYLKGGQSVVWEKSSRYVSNSV